MWYCFLYIGYFILLGSSAIFPLIHYILKHSLKDAVEVFKFDQLLKVGAAYMTGASFYMLLVPEKLFPGKINLIVRRYL